MATASQVRAAVKAVVEAQAVYNTFHSYWNTVKDKPTELLDPCVAWDQWVINASDDPNGYLTKTQRVQLVVFKAMASDRSAEDRDVAAEDAADAALSIVLALRGTYANYFSIASVLITPIYDEETTFETGVVLQFTVVDEGGMCNAGEPGVLPDPVPGSFELNDLSDVDAASPSDGQALVFQASTQTWVPASIAGGGVTDHGALTGLGDDDHPQYHNDARGDARYDALGSASAAEANAISAAAADATSKANAAQAAAIATASSDATTKANAAQSGAEATAASALAAHTVATDPHGDRAYAAGLVSAEQSARIAADALKQDAGVPVNISLFTPTDATGTTYINQPASLNFWKGASRNIIQADLTGRSQIKLNVLTSNAGSANAKILVRYRTEAQNYNATPASWATIGTTEVQASISTGLLATNSGYIDIAAAAKGPVLIALMCIDGDATADPLIVSASIDVK